MSVSSSSFAAGPLLARGRTADVHAWGEDQVVKLYHEWFGLGAIEYEQSLARAVYASGVRCPAVGEIVQIDGRNGLVYERVRGSSMLEVMQRQPWRVLSFATSLAELHVQMHSRPAVAGLPEQSLRIRGKLDAAAPLPAALRARLLVELGQLPGGDRVCHGDFHPGNVLVTPDGAVVIDWIDATSGNPLADVARASILALGAADSRQVTGLLGYLVRLFHGAYLRHYFRLRPGGRDEYRRWLPVVAGARLSEDIPELERYLLAQAGRV